MNFLWNFIQLFFKRLNSYTYLTWKLYEFLLVIFVLYAMLQIKSHSNTNTGVHTQTLLVSGSWVRCRKKKCRIQKHRKNFSSRYFCLLNSSSLNMKLWREKSDPQRVWTKDSFRSTKFVDALQFFFSAFLNSVFLLSVSCPGTLLVTHYILILREEKNERTQT